MDIGWTQSWEELAAPPCMTLADYAGAQPRWCPGCGDHGVLGALQRVCRDEQLPPEKTVIVSGIGCSSRLPHYMATYGFHGLHGRPLPIAEGVRSRRPDLHLFVVTGDGDCCAIGTAHWIHAIRYNMHMTVLLLDNNIYGLTKMQSSPTTPLAVRTNTHPRGTPTEPLNPLSVVLGVNNASFVAQTVDWNPAHVHATLLAAHRHAGLSFVRILQRCPHYLPHLHDEVQADRGGSCCWSTRTASRWSPPSPRCTPSGARTTRATSPPRATSPGTSSGSRSGCSTGATTRRATTCTPPTASACRRRPRSPGRRPRSTAS